MSYGDCLRENNPQFDWEEFDNKLLRKPKGRKRKDTGGWSAYHPYCQHWRQPVAVGRYQVTCSTFNSGRDLRAGRVPDFGIYLHKGWNSGVFTTNGSYLKALANRRDYPMLFVEWPDMGVLKADDLDVLVEICLSKIRHGKKVDIACNAGHGRTGTLLACLIARVEHLPGLEAISLVRRRYCSHAVETLAQEDAVMDYARRKGYRK